MRVSIDHVSVRFIRALIYPLVLVSRLFRFLGGDRKPVYKSTIEGDPLAHDGELPVLIAVWSAEASVWIAATADIVQQLQQEFAGRCEFAYVEATSRSITQRYGAEIVPLLILRHRGRELGRFVNTMELDEVRPALEAATG